MKFSVITRQDGIKLDNYDLEELGTHIVNELASKGFLTSFDVKNNRLKIGMRMKSFIIDTNMHGHNSRFSPHRQKPVRTSTPTWDQRVVYNDTINDIMDTLGLTAIIKNSVFIIRDKEGRKNEQYWIDNEPEYMQHNVSRGYTVLKAV